VIGGASAMLYLWAEPFWRGRLGGTAHSLDITIFPPACGASGATADAPLAQKITWLARHDLAIFFHPPSFAEGITS